MDLYARLADLPLVVEEYGLVGHARDVSSGFLRRTSEVRLRGRGEEGAGEDVTYDAEDHEALQAAGPVLPLAGSWTLDGFCRALDRHDLFPQPARRASSRLYRRWAFESAALDLALRQAKTSLAAALEIEPRPVRFVVSLRLGDPPRVDPLRRFLDADPDLRFKLDPTSAWGDLLLADLMATGAVAAIDLKGYYRGTVVDQEADVDLYRRVIEGLPEALIEDPAWTEETAPLLEEHRDRVTWDAPLHSVADLLLRPLFPPRTVNVKPSRFGLLSELLRFYACCEARGIACYGGGQFELGVGRGQVQYLASLFHPDGPNDVAPGGYNLPEPPEGLPRSPLPPRPAPTGFRWEG